jgi:hypothetical protein
LFAVLAALCNACNVVTQHVASTRAPKQSGWRLGLYLVRNPTWLLGELALIAAFVFQAIALHFGALSLVQPILVTELVFSLLIRKMWIHFAVSAQAWTAVSMICGGLAAFLVVAEPRGGTATPTSAHWALAIGLIGGAVGVFALVAAGGSPKRRAALYGAAAGLVWALEATFIKAATDSLSEFGVSGALIRWPVYAVVVGGIAGTLLVQAALHVGPLNVSQPLMVTVDPLVSIVLGVWLYDEYFTAQPLQVTVAVLAFAVMTAGVVLITRTVGASTPAAA